MAFQGAATTASQLSPPASAPAHEQQQSAAAYPSESRQLSSGYGATKSQFEYFSAWTHKRHIVDKHKCHGLIAAIPVAIATATADAAFGTAATAAATTIASTSDIARQTQ